MMTKIHYFLVSSGEFPPIRKGASRIFSGSIFRHMPSGRFETRPSGGHSADLLSCNFTKKDNVFPVGWFPSGGVNYVDV